LTHIEQLDLYGSAQTLNMNLFIECIILTYKNELFERNLEFIMTCLETFLHHTTRETHAQILANPAGLFLLSICLSRASRIYRQEWNEVSPIHQIAWKSQFEQFFNQLRGSFIYVFSNPFEELIWGFLSSVTLLSNQEQKIDLLTEIKDVVLQKAILFKRSPSKQEVSINTFLKCLGLSVDQLLDL
jgi:hypothetical protein